MKIGKHTFMCWLSKWILPRNQDNSEFSILYHWQDSSKSEQRKSSVSINDSILPPSEIRQISMWNSMKTDFGEISDKLRISWLIAA